MEGAREPTTPNLGYVYSGTKLDAGSSVLPGGEVTSKGILYGQPLPDFICKFPDIISRIKETGVFADSPHKEPNHVIMNEYRPGQGIMPHEDGPIYHPVVATLTLGSQCVFHYYQYKDRGEESPTDSSASTGKGRPIDPKPVHSLLLERRSLVISFGDLYTSHLHGIDEMTEDLILPPANSTTPTPPGSSGVESTATRIDNFHLLRDEGLKEAIRQGQSIKRETRWSLTCRDVSRTASLGIRSLRIG
ncbi:hypothetical protein CC2G_002023 [Coprinopsis cinerea AmutBmut pab1-1]|nr:hypothetical protein CC2G_002023 [Coprinopsis cinerea AmutBmut pab1-1]